VIVAGCGTTVSALQQETKTIPIVVLAARESKHRVSARARCGYAIVGVQRLTIPITYGADLKPAIEQFAAGPNGALRVGRA
jgi:hypothetical protein